MNSAKLAGIWSVDPDENHRELLTFILTHRDATYTPIEASAHAQKLKVRAEQALAASEERALREFVIGRLPNAIGSAWTRLQDWVVEVNKKMRSAAASSTRRLRPPRSVTSWHHARREGSSRGTTPGPCGVASSRVAPGWGSRARS